MANAAAATAAAADSSRAHWPIVTSSALTLAACRWLAKCKHSAAAESQLAANLARPTARPTSQLVELASQSASRQQCVSSWPPRRRACPTRSLPAAQQVALGWLQPPPCVCDRPSTIDHWPPHHSAPTCRQPNRRVDTQTHRHTENFQRHRGSPKNKPAAHFEEIEQFEAIAAAFSAPK